MRIELHVDGTPAPKGSKTAWVPINKQTGQPFRRPNGGVVVHTMDSNPKPVKEWNACVAAVAREAMQEAQMFTGVALAVHVVFRLVRPQGHWGKRGLLPSAPAYPATKPDLDKLIRATMDPLEGVVYDGDSRIVHFDARKVYCAHGEVAGADITIELAEAPAARADDVQPSLAMMGGV